MAIVSFPRGIGVRGVRWQPPFDTAQLNRSEYTGGAQVVELPGGGRWNASGDFVTMIGQDASLDVRRFQSGLRGPLNFFALPAWEKRQATQLATTTSIAALTAGSGTSVSTRTLTKTGVAFAYDAQVTSAISITSGCTLLFRPAQTNATIMCGINTDPLTDAGFASIDHAIQVTELGVWHVYEGGTFVSINLPYAAGDLFEIEYTNAAVNYYQNGALVRSVAKAAGVTFWMDSSFFTPGGALTDVAFHGRNLVTAGQGTARLWGFPINTLNVARAGWFATALFEDGSAQLMMLQRDAHSEADGSVVVTFDATLRKSAYAIIIDYPFAHMRLADGAEFAVDPGQIYSAGFTATEAW